MIRFRLFRIPFEIGIYFWIGSALLGAGAATGANPVLKLAIWVACVLLSIVVHELGHALMARRYGVQPTVVLHGIGGLTYLPGARLTRPQAMLVSLAGPAAGLALFGVVDLIEPVVFHSAAFNDDRSLVSYAVALIITNLIFINLYWTIFNLLPILPLDGGQVLRELLGPFRLQITRAIGASCSAGLCVYMALAGQFYLAIFLGILAVLNYRGGAGTLPGGVQKG